MLDDDGCEDSRKSIGTEDCRSAHDLGAFFVPCSLRVP
jgi:hypothetical protein